MILEKSAHRCPSKREWASISAMGVEIRWCRDHPSLNLGIAKIEQMIREGYVG